MWDVTLRQPWLMVDFAAPMRCMGWTPQGGGSTVASGVLWRQVRNQDLSADFDVIPWLAHQTQGLGRAEVPCFMTSANIDQYEQASATCEGYRASVLVTAGLGNAERIGQRQDPAYRVGTINALLGVGCALSPSAMLEALSLMAEARTVSMLDHAPDLWECRPTGTGTDCLCVASALSGQAEDYAGKHTPLGEAIGRAAMAAFGVAISKWRMPT